MSIEPTKLAGCPFCGSAAELVLNDEKEPDLWLVSCRGCIASIEEVGKSSAIAAWNRRSHPVLPDREGFAAALRWAMDEIDVLSNKLSGFAYPQGMVYARRSGTELQNYAKAVEARRSLAASPATGEREPSRATDTGVETHGLDTQSQVFFYEQDFYVLSNFSAFNLLWDGVKFATSEHAYHWEKFAGVKSAGNICQQISFAPSAHEAFKIAERNKDKRRADWDMVKIDIMRDILRAKVDQHEYVRRKLLATGDRELIENSWRDDFWGWGPNRDGQNMLGKLWMEVRAELRPAPPHAVDQGRARP